MDRPAPGARPVSGGGFSALETDGAHVDMEAGRSPSKKFHVDSTFVFTWKHVSYTVTPTTALGKKLPQKQILFDVSGRVAPGELTACMGPSGSGKTTLLDILADRVSSGKIEGSVEVNGVMREAKSFRTISSYVSQEDSLMGSFSVLETLRFAASLSLPRTVSAAEKEERVQRAMDEMGLRKCENTHVGDIFRKGISGGQKRRLSIAIELLSNPSILLLDEPTSGLDSSSTFNVVKYIKHLCSEGRTVVCTIHQPSSLVFDMFTNVLLLASGRTVYFGSTPDALTHFGRLGYPCPQYSNPAEHYVGLINADFEGPAAADVSKFAGEFASGPQMIKLLEDVNRDSQNGGGVPKSISALEPPASTQFFVLLHRNMLNNLRNPGIFWVRLVMYIMLSFMVGTMYLRTNSKIKEEDKVPLLFYVQAFLVFMAVAVLPFFIEQRAVFLRERANSSLNVVSYVFANFFAALPGIFLIAIVSTVLVVELAGLNSFGYFLVNLFLSLVVAESLMHVIGSAVPHYIIGIALGAGIFGMFMLCEGFMVPKTSIPPYWIWGYYMAFHTYSFKSFVYKEFISETSPMAMNIIAKYDLADTDVPLNMGILVLYAVVFQLIFAGILYKFHTGRR